MKYWGLGNENWGFGGRMTAEYYVDKAVNYSVFCRNYPGNELYKIACVGYADRDDYHWTEVLMRDVWKRIRFGAHAIHYYSNGTLRPRKTAADFEEAGWFDIIRANFKMDDIIKKNIAIMDRYDLENEVDLIVDEWGNWFEMEPGTNPRFLFQQNILRDALGAAIQLNIFNNYCERGKMTNIAQTVNVLQAMILTKKEKIIKTPTYYIYKMFTVHHDATMLHVNLKCVEYTFQNDKLPAINASASLNEQAQVHVSMVNVDPNINQQAVCTVHEKDVGKVTAQVITAHKMNDFNDFGQAEKVSLKKFTDFKVQKNDITVTMPSKSIVMLEIE